MKKLIILAVIIVLGNWAFAVAQQQNFGCALLNAANTFTAAQTFTSINLGEMAAPAGVVGATVCYADSTTHHPTCSFTGGAFNPILVTTGGTTNGIPKFGDTTHGYSVASSLSDNATTVSTTEPFSTTAYQTSTKCAAVGSAASPSVAACSAAAAGVFSCNDTVGGLCQVNTTALINANSTVLVFQDESTLTGTLLGVTCLTTASLLVPATTVKVAATSFTVKVTPNVANPDCFQYYIIN
jgi:hypothetical protein